MSEGPDRLREPYIAVLEDYFAGGGETALQRAYELGRGAMLEGIGVLEITEVYHQALTTVLERTPTSEQIRDRIRMATTLFAESLSPFEMFQRGFEEINALRCLNEELAGYAAEFGRIQAPQAEPDGANVQMEALRKAFDDMGQR